MAFRDAEEIFHTEVGKKQSYCFVQTSRAAEIIKKCNKAGDVCNNSEFLRKFAKGLGPPLRPPGGGI